MLTIRFARTGRRNKAQFRIVLQEKTAAPTGRHVEVLGSYDPHSKNAVLKADKIKDWVGKGAQVSDSVYNLFVKEGVIEGKKRAVKMERPKPIEKTVEEAVPTEEAAEEKKEEVAEEVKEEAKAE